MSTKEQERKALEQIKKIVAGLGNDSYIAMAFEGCFEIAEENIENDFGCSMKQRAESAERKVKELEDRLAESEKDYEAAHATAHLIAEEKDAEIARLNAEIEDLKKRTLSNDDISDCKDLIMETIFGLDSKVREAAEEIVKHADEPASAEFVQAVKDHRAAQSKLDYYMSLKMRLGDAQRAGA